MRNRSTKKKKTETNHKKIERTKKKKITYESCGWLMKLCFNLSRKNQIGCFFFSSLMLKSKFNDFVLSTVSIDTRYANDGRTIERLSVN